MVIYVSLTETAPNTRLDTKLLTFYRFGSRVHIQLPAFLLGVNWRESGFQFCSLPPPTEVEVHQDPLQTTDGESVHAAVRQMGGFLGGVLCPPVCLPANHSSAFPDLNAHPELNVNKSDGGDLLPQTQTAPAIRHGGEGAQEPGSHL